MFTLAYSETAIRDIEDIGGYLTSVQNADFAKAYLERLRLHIQTLQHNGHRFRERAELGPGRRALVEPPYLIFYRMIGSTVYILRVLHGARQITPETFRD